ncbi:hypothetical protein OC835_000520 [Tilletia horrida]|nr:hypothetical protein OC835_000520 [Tilletia horrida]
MPVPSSWHVGQLIAQSNLGWVDEVPPPPHVIQESIDDHYSRFFSEVHFLPLTTLDVHNRPWTSLLGGREGQTGFVRPVYVRSLSTSDSASARGKLAEPGLQMTVSVPKGTPFHSDFQGEDNAKSASDVLRHPNGQPLVAAVGVMLHNRRRNKLNGFIHDFKYVADDQAVVTLGVDSTHGNCPKYINVRHLRSLDPKTVPVPSLEASNFTMPKGIALPQSALDVVEQADIVFLGSRHTPKARSDPSVANQSDALWGYRPEGDQARLGCNHRGGRPGFVRTYFDEEKGRTCIVLPDYSGNRFMESIGNMVTDPVGSLAIPRFSFLGDGRGMDVLHVTGDVEMLFGQDAKKEIRGIHQVTKIWVTGFSLVHNALPIAVAPYTPEQAPTQLDARVGWSPYNPPVKMLAYEKADASQLASNQTLQAELSRIHIYTPTLGSFTWKVDDKDGTVGRSIRAGQHVIMDMSAHADSRLKMYSHMARHRGGEKDLNDDGVRSWTISSIDAAAPYAFLTTTLRRVNGGAVTSQLFNRARVVYETDGKELLQDHETLQEALQNGVVLPSIAYRGKVQAPLLGIGGEFTIPSPPSAADPLRLMYLVNGIGVTPLLAHLEELSQPARAPTGDRAVAVVAVVCCRPDEALALRQLIQHALRAATNGDKASNTAPLSVTTILVEKSSESESETVRLASTHEGDVHFHHIKGGRVGEQSLILNQDATNANFNLPAVLAALNVDASAEIDVNADVKAADVLAADSVFVCGTSPFERAVRSAIAAREAQADSAGRKANVVTESFSF